MFSYFDWKYLGFEEKQRELKESEFVEEMGEDEYDALPEEEKQRIDQKRLQKKKDRLLKYDDKLMFSFNHLSFQRATNQRRKSSIRTGTFISQRSRSTVSTD